MTKLENKILFIEFPYLYPTSIINEMNWYDNVKFNHRGLFINMLREINEVLDEYDIPYEKFHITALSDGEKGFRMYYILDNYFNVSQIIFKIICKYNPLYKQNYEV